MIYRASAALALAVLLPALCPVAAQPAAPDARVADAEVRAAAGDFAGAARALRPYVREHPGDAGAWLRLGQAIYWSGDAAGARAELEQAHAAHPDHAGLRLAFGRVLAETNDAPAARRVLEPLREDAEAGAEAERLLGQVAYWQGDLAAAARHLHRARARNPADADAARLLGELRARSRPWARLQAGAQTDTQPLGGAHAHAEAGAFLTPLQTLRAHAATRQLRPADSSRTLASAGLAHGAFWPALGLDTEIGAGVLARGGDAPLDWTGRASLGVRLPRYVGVTVAAERAGYFYTVASIFTPVTTESAGLTLAWSPPGGWSAQAGARRTRFGDGNAQTDAWAWALAPLVSGAWGGVQAGYAFGAQHADTSRFQAVLTAPPAPRQPAQFEGRYVPYYTPDRLRTHTLAWAVQLRPAARLSLDVGGGYGVRATEQAPFLFRPTPAAPPVRGVYTNAFHPWDARAGAQLEVAPGLTLGLHGSHATTAFYSATQGHAALYYRFP